MLNLWLLERLLVRVVAAIILSHVCWQVFSPGAEINQNSVMAAALVPLEQTEGRTLSGLMCVLCYNSAKRLIKHEGTPSLPLYQHSNGGKAFRFGAFCL